MTPEQQRQYGPRQGFTIIEVVLVLAIAGLIFLMVFIALPALQRSQRDTQRRDDMSRVATAITQYQTNNNGKLPTDTTKTNFLNNYLKKGSSGTSEEFQDPDGADYSLDISNDGDTVEAGEVDHVIYIKTKHYCGDEGSVKSGQSRDYAILYKLEGNGVSCTDNR